MILPLSREMQRLMHRKNISFCRRRGEQHFGTRYRILKGGDRLGQTEVGGASCSTECRTLLLSQWVLMLKHINEPPAVLDVSPDASYSFRVIGDDGRMTSPSMLSRSDADGGAEWEAKRFVDRYLELDELGSGRFPILHARDKDTGQEVALKQIPPHKQSRSPMLAEYDLLASTDHVNIVRAFALFAPRAGMNTWNCKLHETTEMDACTLFE